MCPVLYVCVSMALVSLRWIWEFYSLLTVNVRFVYYAGLEALKKICSVFLAKEPDVQPCGQLRCLDILSGYFMSCR